MDHITSLSFFLSFLKAVEEGPLLNRLLALRRQLVACSFSSVTKHKLGLQAPLQWNVPNLASLLVGQRVVVLKIGAETFGFESRPDFVLVHGGGVFGPLVFKEARR